MSITWIFPVEEGEDGLSPEMAQVHGFRRVSRDPFTGARSTHPMRFMLGADLSFTERDLPIIRAFLDAHDAAPSGTEIIKCSRCDCPTVRVDSELWGLDSSGTECEEHECMHSCRYPDPDPELAPRVITPEKLTSREAANVLIAHQQLDNSSCACGLWEWGASHAAHVLSELAKELS